MTPQEALNAATDAYYAATNVVAAQAALDRMVEIADESGMYDLPPQQPR